MSSPVTVVQSILTIDSLESSQESDSAPQLDSTSCNTTDAATNTEKSPVLCRPLIIYTRPQLLSLSKSPMVKPPPDMPDLKTWFGIENESIVNKKDELLTPNTARDRRFRRDVDDGDAPSRPALRSTLQPSQMGNFKHQSLRERDRDRDADKERDKDGNERLRHLADKYDRDRLLPLPSSRKDSNGSRAAPSNGASRRSEAREAAKKKVGESTEDWRRGAEPPRSIREERTENAKRDREERDRARSRVRDSSRPKREPSTSRRDKDEPRERARDRDRDDHRRESSRSRRDRDDQDDSRHWRDDGKRDERMAARRERERGRTNQDRELDDRRWVASDDRDGRYKRTAGRDRKALTAGDEGKDKDDRRDKEKEPAWMDTYIPSESSYGILGGQAPNGELDGIQVWKKGLREKETKEREAADASTSFNLVTEQPPSSTSEKPLDEIQLFRMLMKKEEDKKRLEDVSADVKEANSPSRDDATGQSHHLGVTDDLKSVPTSLQCKISLPSLNSPSTSSAQLKDPAILSSIKVNLDSYPERMVGRHPSTVSPDFAAGKPPVEPTGNAAFPPIGSRVLAMTNKTSLTTNAPLNLQNGGPQSVAQEQPQLFVKNEPVRPGFSPFSDPIRPSHGLDDSRDLPIPSNQSNVSQRLPIDQLFHTGMNAQSETNYNTSLNKGSRLAKIFENKSRDIQGPPSKPQIQSGYISPSPTQNQRQELNALNSLSNNPVHSVEELMAMLNNSSQRTNVGFQSGSHSNHATFSSNQVSGLHSLQQHHLLHQQQLASNRLEPLYESRTEDRTFVPDGMVPGLRTAPPPAPRGRESLGHYNDALDDHLHYNLQRITQQQTRNIDPLFNGSPGPLFNQQPGRHGGGLPLQSLQQSHYRGGPSPALNQTASGLQSHRLPPGLANLGGRPPHDPSQFIGLQGLAPGGPQHNIHGNGPVQQQQLPFNAFANNTGLTNAQARGPLLQNTGGQQLPLGNLGHHSLDPRLSNHHHLMGIGGSGTRINGGFSQQVPNGPSNLGIRPQQQPQLLPHMLPHLLPPPMQQGHPSNNPQNHDLMALLMGGPLRE